MKILLFTIVVLMLLMARSAMADPFSVLVNQRNSTDTGTIQRVMPPVNGVLAFDAAINQPIMATLGPGITLTSSVLAVNTSTIPAGATGATGPQGIQGIPGTNATTTNTATTSLNGLMSSSDKTKLDGLKTRQCTRATTDAAGAYTFNFSPAFTGTPAIQVTPESSSSDTISHKVTASSASAVSLQLSRTAAVTILGISVLGIATNAATVVNVCAFQL